jgi:TonB family protein
MQDLIHRNWSYKQQAEGTTVMKFTIRRDGRLINVEVERSSGSAALDYFSQRALALVTQLPPLPPAYDQPMLTVHIGFEYRR